MGPYTGGRLTQRLSLPLFLIRLLSRFLPGRAWADLRACGLDIERLLGAGAAPPQWLHLREGGSQKQVCISRQG